MTGLGKLGCLGRMGNVSSGGGNSNIPVTASGRAFPIWNTTGGDDKLLSLSIHGLTEQDGTPTPDAPVPLQSVGDSGLLLSVMPDKEDREYQLLNIKAAAIKAGHDGVLRSVNGVYDEVVYDGKEWKLIQRIKEYRVDDLAISGNYEFKKWENATNVHYAIGYKTGNDYLVTGVNTPFMSDYSGKPFFPGITFMGVGYYYGELCFSMLNGETTEAEALNITRGRHFQGLLTTPIEYPLDLPAISTYDNQTYFATNAAEVKPRMVATCKVSKALDYIKVGLIGYYTGRGRSNTDENRGILPDLSGNGNDLTNYNMAYTPESGYGDGYIQYDGIDDYSNTPWKIYGAQSIQIVLKDIVSTKVSPYHSDCIMVGDDRNTIGSIVNGFIGVQNRYGYYSGNKLSDSEVYTKDLSKEKGILTIYSGKNDGLLEDESRNYNFCIGAGNYYGQPTRYACQQKFYDALIYDRRLSDEEIAYNYKVSLQFNGDNFDICRSETTASGENGFTVYNSLPGIFNELTIYGKSVQEGTPTPENPIDINSVGDTPLILTISNGTDTQEINFGDIRLRSDGVNGDTLIYKDGQWIYQQRVFFGMQTNLDMFQTQKFAVTEEYASMPFYVPMSSDTSYTNYSTCNKLVNYRKIGNPEPFTFGIYGAICTIYLPPEYDTVDKFLDWVFANDFQFNYGITNYGLPKPIIIDNPAPQALSGEITVMTNQTTVQPYMTARTQVSRVIDYVKRGLLAGFDCLNGNNTDEDKEILKDQSGNGNNIQLKNFAFTADSGYINGGLLFDGIDDFGTGTFDNFPAVAASVNIKSFKSNKPIWDYFFSFNNTEKEFVLINPYATNLGLNELIINDETLVPTIWWMQENTHYRVYAKTDAILTNPATITMGRYTASATNPVNFILKQVLFYSVELTDQEKEQNNKYFKQHS